jgi:hypothetical protein
MDDGLYHDDDDSKRKKELGSSFPTAAAFSEEDVSFGATRKKSIVVVRGENRRRCKRVAWDVARRRASEPRAKSRQELEEAHQ